MPYFKEMEILKQMLKLHVSGDSSIPEHFLLSRLSHSHVTKSNQFVIRTTHLKSTTLDLLFLLLGLSN